MSHLKAPNGKPSNLTPKQWKLVRTPEFKAWFGDWENDPENASKVIDENGEPLVVYHGTYVENPFYIFDFNKADLGFHFGTYEQAKNRSETKLFFKNRKSVVNSFFLNIQNIYEMSDIGEWEYPPRYIDMLVSDGLISESDAKKNGFYRLFHREDNIQIREYLFAKYGKFIGFKYNNKYEGEGKSFIVLNPEQIKLADGSNTTFDGNNPDIRFAEGGTTNDEVDELYDIATRTFIGLGYDVTQGSNSKTDYGHSRYFYVNQDNKADVNSVLGFQVRVSDHSTGDRRILNGEQFIFDNKDVMVVFNRINYWFHPEEYNNLVAVKTKVVQIEVGENDLQPSDEIISERVAKSGNKRYTIKRTYKNEGVVPTHKFSGYKLPFKPNNPDFRFAEGGRVQKMIENGAVELKVYDTTPEHAKEYGLIAYNPLYIQRIFVNENDRNKGLGKEILQYLDKYAKDNGNDLIFGHIQQKANPSRVKILLEKNGYTTIVGNNDFYKFVGKFAEGGTTTSKLKAPNGKPSNLTPEQWKLVRTPQFKAWFGDWENDPENASKVVDENGEPLVVYHGTNSDFWKFEKSKGKGSIKQKAINFSSNKNVSEDYGKRIIQCFLNLKKPIIKDYNGQNYHTITFNARFENRVNDIPDVIVNQAQVEKKYDGVIFLNIQDSKSAYNKFGVPIANNYYAFNNKQIKLADGSNTTFDGNNPDIRFAEGGMTYREYVDTQFNENEDRYLPSGYLDEFQVQQADRNEYPILFKKKNGLEYRIKNNDSSVVVFDNENQVAYADNKAIMVAPTYQKRGIGLELVRILKERNPSHRFGSMTPEGFNLMGKYYDTYIANNPDIIFAEGGKTKKYMKRIKRGGITYGKSHAEGGIPVKNQSTGDMLEVEGGEGIVNKRSMASDKRVKLNGKDMTICEAVSQLNQMEGGVKFSCDDVEDRQFIEAMAKGGELERGTRTEQEHIQVLKDLYAKRITPKEASKRIAKDHLKEDSRYYSKLAKMEGKMANGGEIYDDEGNLIDLKVGDRIIEFRQKTPNNPKSQIGSEGKIIQIVGAMAKIVFEPNDYEQWVALKDLQKMEGKMAKGGKIQSLSEFGNEFEKAKKELYSSNDAYQKSVEEGVAIKNDSLLSDQEKEKLLEIARKTARANKEILESARKGLTDLRTDSSPFYAPKLEWGGNLPKSVSKAIENLQVGDYKFKISHALLPQKGVDVFLKIHVPRQVVEGELKFQIGNRNLNQFNQRAVVNDVLNKYLKIDPSLWAINSIGRISKSTIVDLVLAKELIPESQNIALQISKALCNEDFYKNDVLATNPTPTPPTEKKDHIDTEVEITRWSEQKVREKNDNPAMTFKVSNLVGYILLNLGNARMSDFTQLIAYAKESEMLSKEIAKLEQQGLDMNGFVIKLMADKVLNSIENLKAQIMLFTNKEEDIKEQLNTIVFFIPYLAELDTFDKDYIIHIK